MESFTLGNNRENDTDASFRGRRRGLNPPGLDGLGWETDGLDDGEGASHLNAEYDRKASDFIYLNHLCERVKAINDDVGEINVDRFLNSLRRDLDTDDLMAGNRRLHKLLRTGKQLDAKRRNGTTKPTYIGLINFEDLENNHFVAANQVRVYHHKQIRPDVTLFVNGIPIVQMVLTSLVRDTDFSDAISDLQSYEEGNPDCSSRPV